MSSCGMVKVGYFALYFKILYDFLIENTFFLKYLFVLLVYIKKKL